MENTQQLLTIMQDYSGPEYKDLYEEILLDYHYRFPKYHPIPYPINRNPSNETNNESRTITKGY